MQRRIVIADDHEDMRELMRMIFLGSGWTVIAECEDGDAAVEAWEREREFGVELVLLDQRMPGCTGVEAAERILGMDPTQRIIIASAQLDDNVRARAMAAGVLAAIDKSELLHLPKSALLAN